MKIYNVQIRIERDDNTENVLLKSFNDLKVSQEFFNETLEGMEYHAGQYLWENDFKNSYKEILEIESKEDNWDYETLKEQVVYLEGNMDKNNWMGEYAVNYWAVAKHNGTELVYNFYDNGKDLNLEYENVKDLNKWYNYKR